MNSFILSAIEKYSKENKEEIFQYMLSGSRGIKEIERKYDEGSFDELERAKNDGIERFIFWFDN